MDNMKKLWSKTWLLSEPKFNGGTTTTLMLILRTQTWKKRISESIYKWAINIKRFWSVINLSSSFLKRIVLVQNLKSTFSWMDLLVKIKCIKLLWKTDGCNNYSFPTAMKACKNNSSLISKRELLRRNQPILCSALPNKTKKVETKNKMPIWINTTKWSNNSRVSLMMKID